jgi:hypothetical protein
MKARNTIPVSKAMLCIILTPNKGKLDKNKGNTAQCIAQAIEAVIPRASQLILVLMNGQI